MCLRFVTIVKRISAGSVRLRLGGAGLVWYWQQGG